MIKDKVLDTIIGTLILGIGFLFFYLVRNNELLRSQILQQQAKADALIDEIGFAREDANNIYQQLLDSRAKIEILKQSLSVKKIARTSANAVGSANPVGSLVFTAPPPEQSANVRNAPNAIPVAVAASVPAASSTAAPATINFLIVGQNYKLADTIILAMANPATQKITFVNIPRDLFVNGRKINEHLSLYGIDELKRKVESVSGLQINNFAAFSFQSFAKVINELGGIDIEVSKPIFDSLYPNGSGRYTIYAIQNGMHHMDGDDALKYARSRHSTSDFDRAARQQQIISAVKEKILSLGLLNDLGTIEGVFEAVIGGTQTDISFTDALGYMLRFRNYSFSGGNVMSTANLLYSTVNVRGQYILLPRAGNFSGIQAYIAGLAR